MFIRILSFLSFFIIFTQCFAQGSGGTISPLFITNPFHTSEKIVPPKKIFFHKKPPYLLIGKTKSLELYESRLKDIYLVKMNLLSVKNIESLGTPIDWDTSTGEPLYPKKPLSDLKNESLNNIVLAINGQFFDPKRNPTPLSFGIKSSGVIQTAGADNGDVEKKILVFGSGYAQILPYSWEKFRDSSGDFAIVGLSFDIPNFFHEEIGRTYICLKNPSKENISEKVLIFFTRSLSEYSAKKILLQEGCQMDSSIKLDSSGSSQLLFGKYLIYGNAHKGSPDNRKIPHAIGFSEY